MSSRYFDIRYFRSEDDVMKRRHSVLGETIKRCHGIAECELNVARRSRSSTIESRADDGSDRGERMRARVRIGSYAARTRREKPGETSYEALGGELSPRGRRVPNIYPPLSLPPPPRDWDDRSIERTSWFSSQMRIYSPLGRPSGESAR